MKLIRFITQSTGLARREVMQRLRESRIGVNGSVQSAATVEVNPGVDRVTMDGKRVRAKPPIHLMLYKPRNTICSRNDPQGRPTIYDLLKPRLRRAATIGRLDFNTTGVLLLTTDGELAQRLTRPQYKVPRTYRVKLRGNVAEDRLDRWRKGMRIEGRRTRPARVHVVSRFSQGATVQVTLIEGQNREIHRLAEAVGLTAAKIHRMRFATITLGTLKPGQYRELTTAEIKKLRKSVGLS